MTFEHLSLWQAARLSTGGGYFSLCLRHSSGRAHQRQRRVTFRDGGCSREQLRLRKGGSGQRHRSHARPARGQTADPACIQARGGFGWLYELRLGSEGLITERAIYADASLTRIWHLHKSGSDPAAVRDAYSKFVLDGQPRHDPFRRLARLPVVPLEEPRRVRRRWSRVPTAR